jgi:hypothetical protein
VRSAGRQANPAANTIRVTLSCPGYRPQPNAGRSLGSGTKDTDRLFAWPRRRHADQAWTCSGGGRWLTNREASSRPIALEDTRVRLFRMAGCAGLLVVLVGCGGPVEPSAGIAATPHAAERLKATPSMDPSSITVLVTFVGGPADGRTEWLPLRQAAGEVTISGVAYRGSFGPPAPEVKETTEGLAEVLRPVPQRGRSPAPCVPFLHVAGPAVPCPQRPRPGRCPQPQPGTRPAFPCPGFPVSPGS